MTESELLTILVLIGVAPITGSMLGTLVLRVPIGRAFFIARSSCDDCGHVLGVWDLMPVVNWIISRGRCRHCGAGVSAFYPLIELAAVVVVLWSWSATAGAVLWFTAVLGWLLMVLVLINLNHYKLPVGIVVPLLPLGVLAAWSTAPAAMFDHLLGAIAGFAAGALIVAVERQSGRGLGMGWQGALLLATAGAWVSWRGLADVAVVTVIAAVVLTATPRIRRIDENGRLPIGAALCIAIWLAWLYGPVLAG